MKDSVRNIVFPLLAAMIWGTAFAFQSMASGAVEACTFNMMRFLIAFAALGLGIPLLKKLKLTGKGRSTHKEIRSGIICGIALAFASALQQYGIGLIGAGKAGFLTTLYVVLVPIGTLFLGSRPKTRIWICTGAFLIGVYLLSVKSGFVIETGDAAVLGCAVLFALHILLIDRLSGDTDPIRLSLWQFASACIVSAVLMLLTEKPVWRNIAMNLPQLLYCGVMSSAVAYTLQVTAQKGSNPTLVTLLLCLESVFAAVSGNLILGESMTAREISGCVIMLGASAAAQIDGNSKKLSADG